MVVVIACYQNSVRRAFEMIGDHSQQVVALISAILHVVELEIAYIVVSKGVLLVFVSLFSVSEDISCKSRELFHAENACQSVVYIICAYQIILILAHLANNERFVIEYDRSASVLDFYLIACFGENTINMSVGFLKL